MAVAMMPVLVVVLIIRVAGSVVIRVSAFVMVVIMRMEARAGHVFAHVPMQSGRRCPGELERNDEHNYQGDEATHAGDCTALDVLTKGSPRGLAVWHAGLLVPDGSPISPMRAT